MNQGALAREEGSGPDRRVSPVRVAVVIPCFRVARHILGVIAAIGPEVSSVFVVDDRCPEGSGALVEAECKDPRVRVLYNSDNRGVGGAVLRGYANAIADGADVIVKIDGDGQMDPRVLPRMVGPILKGQADYTKGNRFYELSRLGQMPALRVFGNSALSFLAKLSTGYWTVFDPNNGYTAIHSRVARNLPTAKISRRYFFETDMLFRLNTLRAVVVDIPTHAIYGSEVSNLSEWRVALEFLVKHLRNFVKRIAYNYFLRDMSIASLELVIGMSMLGFGLVFGAYRWLEALHQGTVTPLGIIMLAALPVLVGLQLVLAFLSFDIANVPKRPVHDDLPEPDMNPALD